MNFKKISILFLIGLLFCLAISVNAFGGDYILINKNILEQNKSNALIIENKQFYLSDFLPENNAEIEEEVVHEFSFTRFLSSVEELKSEKELARKNADMSSAGINVKYPFYITHTTIEEYDYILKGTKLAGYGYCFKLLEDEYGVNGLFAISVATLESGLGKSNLGQSNNNFYGIRGGGSSWAKFESKEAGILYFGKLMNNKLYKGKTITQIAPIYCNEGWAVQVSSIITRYVNRIEVFNNEKT